MYLEGLCSWRLHFTSGSCDDHIWLKLPTWNPFIPTFGIVFFFCCFVWFHSFITLEENVQKHHSTVIKLAWHVKHPGNMATTYSDSHMLAVACIISKCFLPHKHWKPNSSVFLCTQPYGNACYTGCQSWSFIVPKWCRISKSLPSWNSYVSFRNVRRTSKLISINLGFLETMFSRQIVKANRRETFLCAYMTFAMLKVPMKRNFFFEPMLTYQVLNKNCSIWVASVLSLTFFPSLKIVFRGSKVVPFRARPKHSCQVTMT